MADDRPAFPPMDVYVARSAPDRKHKNTAVARVTTLKFVDETKVPLAGEKYALYQGQKKDQGTLDADGLATFYTAEGPRRRRRHPGFRSGQIRGRSRLRHGRPRPLAGGGGERPRRRRQGRSRQAKEVIFGGRFAMKPVSALLVCLAFAPTAVAGEKEGVRLPDTLPVGDKSLVLNGMGVREATIFNVNVYVAGLYLEAKSSNPDEIIGSDKVKRLDLVFVRDVDRDDIVDAWSSGFKNNGADMAKLKDRIGKIYSWMTDVKKKDVLSFTYVPDKGLTVVVKGAEKGTIAGADFAKAFFSIWLGPEPPNKSLKRGLLGKD
jgi:hypothetical protein